MVRMYTRGLFKFVIYLIVIFSSTNAFAVTSNFISAPSRVDMVHDDARGILYITSGNSVLRYKLSTSSFLTPYSFNQGDLAGIDLSPDGNTLAIADRNVTGIHLVDLQTDSIKPDIMFTPAYGEGGSFAVAYGNDGALLATTGYNGSGWVPLRRVDPATGVVTTIKSTVRQDAMVSASADGNCIAYEESNISSGPVNIYDVATKSVTKTVNTGGFTYEVGTNRDCTQLAVPTYGGTYIYDGSLTKLGTIGVYAGGQPIGVAYHPLLDVAYFAWAGSNQIRAYDTKTFAQLTPFVVGTTFGTTGNDAFDEGRLRISRDGSLLFATVSNGVMVLRTGLNPVADNKSIAISNAAATAITLSGSSPKQLPITYTVLTDPVHGTLQGTAPSLTYAPDPEYSGQDSFTFKVSDGTLDSSPATVSITIDKAAPAITSFTMPELSKTLTVQVLTLSAGDNVGVSGYCLTENETTASCIWTAVPPASYRFGGIGIRTVKAFARDAAGNVSAPVSASVDIPEIAPKITAFSIPATYGYKNRTIAVTLSASDDLGVTGYCLTEVANQAGCSWKSTAPTTYTVATLGPHTLYAFAKNSAGKVSTPATASTTVAGEVNFIPASGRNDMVHDSVRDVVYITSGPSVLRFKPGTQSFLPPYSFGLGNLTGMDLSPDGNTLAIADKNISGIHLVDLQNDTILPDIRYTPNSSEGGTHSVAFGSDGALLVTAKYDGSGWVPLRRIDPATGAVSIIKSSISQDAMLSASADGRCIAYAESNNSSGPVSIYNVATESTTNKVSSNWFTYEVGANRDCTQFAVPTYGGTFIYDNTLTKLDTVGVYAGGQPVGVAYNPLSDIVYFAWAGSKEIRAYDTKTMDQVASYDVGHTFLSSGNKAYVDGRIKTSRDGSMLLVSIQNGVRYRRISSSGPTADDQIITTYAGTPLPVTLIGSSPDQAALTYTITTPPAHGSLQGTGANLTYLPEAGYAGVDSIAFKVNDGTRDSNGATMVITTKPVPSNVAIDHPTVKGELTLSWSNPPDPAFNHIHIYRSTAAGTLGSLIADNLNATSYTNSGLASLTTYFYTVRYVDASGFESTNTNQVSKSTLDDIPPVTTATPRSGTYPSAQEVTLICSDNTGEECAATYYCLGNGCTPATRYISGRSIAVASSTALRFFSADQVGNVESVRTENYVFEPRYLVVSPDPVNVGGAFFYYPVSTTVTIGNLGTLPLAISAPLNVSGPDSAMFIVKPGGPTPCSSLQPALAAGQSCTLTVTFTPDSTGMKQAYLDVFSNADNEPVMFVSLTGMGVYPVYLVTHITGKGSVNNIAQPPAFSCDAPSCAAPYAAGTSMTLRATPSSMYKFSGWSGGECSGMDDCELSLVTGTTVVAEFTPLPLVRLNGGNATYLTFGAALADVPGRATLESRNVTITENLDLKGSQEITLIGGLNDDFATVGGVTVLDGTLKIRQGSLKVKGLAVR
ncbi:MAG: hypothetical protein A2075_11000 [Geobacteraceae bacterium GWC2_58_44]|nr:MAG: hypothetical protein A2075_11000 [Geobacteraceae bacterium GWC2_58_44]